MASVNISGTILASLWHHAESAPTDIEGLLLGNLRETSKKTLQDLGEVSTDESEFGLLPKLIEPYLTIDAVIQSFFCLPERFYDWEGKIDFEKLKLDDVLPADTTTSIIGFFKARRSSPLRPALRERAILSHFCEIFKQGPHNPLFLLFTQEANIFKSIYSFDYKIYTFLKDKCVTLPLNITNLMQSTQDEYDSFTVRSLHTENGSNSIFQGLCGSIKNSGIIPAKLENSYRNALHAAEKLASELHSTVNQVRETENEITLLRSKIKSLELAASVGDPMEFELGE